MCARGWPGRGDASRSPRACLAQSRFSEYRFPTRKDKGEGEAPRSPEAGPGVTVLPAISQGQLMTEIPRLTIDPGIRGQEMTRSAPSPGGPSPSPAPPLLPCPPLSGPPCGPLAQASAPPSPRLSFPGPHPTPAPVVPWWLASRRRPPSVLAGLLWPPSVPAAGRAASQVWPSLRLPVGGDVPGLGPSARGPMVLGSHQGLRR